MAKYEAGVGDDLTVKVWSKGISAEALKRTTIYGLVSDDEYGIIQKKDELTKGPGDSITYGLVEQFSGAGRQGGEVLEGHEEAISTFSDSLVIDTLRHGARSDSDSSITQQRVPFNIRKQMLNRLADWFADRWDTAALNQLCGYTVETDTKYTGNQTVTAYDTGHVIRPRDEDKDEDLAAGDEFTLDLLDWAVEQAETLDPPIRRANLGNGMKKYVCIIHPYQKTSLRRSAQTAGSWFDIQQAAMQGGDVTGNPIFSGALGVYNDVLLLCNTRITQGVGGAASDGAAQANVRRAVFLGAQAACIAFGQNNGLGRLNWKEKFFDYEEQLGVSAKTIYGMKATRFNSKHYGSLLLPTYATAKGS